MVLPSFAELIETPLKQMQKGVLAKNVVCQTGYKLILKTESGRAACVTPKTLDKLVVRGWGNLIQIVINPKENSSNSHMTNQTNQTLHMTNQTNQTLHMANQTNQTLHMANQTNQTLHMTNQTNPTTSSSYHGNLTMGTYPNKTTPISYRLAFLSTSNQSNIQILENSLVSGDYIFVNTPLGSDSKASAVIQEAADIKNKVKPGVHVYTVVWYSKISDIESRVPNLPKGIDYVVYDYEGGQGFAPEYTNDQLQSITLFDRAIKSAHDNGFKLIVTPTYGDKPDWDWGEISKHMDALVIQFQGFFFYPNTDIAIGKLQNSILQISEKSPNLLVLVQLSITPSGGTIDENMDAIHKLQNKNITKFLIFYNSLQTSDLNNFLDKR